MSPNLGLIVQGLYECGSLERGHAYLKAHASEITSEFIDALRGCAMNLLTQEQPEPDLAKVFAELAIVAAIYRGSDHDKGMACFCKGTMLARLEEYHAALDLLNDAQTYLTAARSTAQLANCLTMQPYVPTSWVTTQSPCAF